MFSARQKTQPNPSDVEATPDPHRRRALLWLAICFALTTVAGLLSDGVYHEDDLKHFLYARWSQHDPNYLLDDWGRPGFTIPYALPALIGPASVGWHACRLLSALLSAGTAWLAWRIARQLRFRHAWLAIPLVYFQPLLTHLSLTTLTETPMAFYLALGTWLLLRDKPAASAAVVALAPITRHEAVILLPIWAVALWRTRASWTAYAALGWAILLYNLASFVVFDHLPVERFLTPAGSTAYGQGTPLTFIPALLLSAGPIVAPLAVIGCKRVVTRRLGWLVVGGSAAYFLAETVLYTFGSYSSGGYARFLVPLAPWLAVLATAGLQPVFLLARPGISIKTVLAIGSTLIILCVICQVEWLMRPPKISDQWEALARAGRILAGCFLLMLAAALYRIRQVSPDRPRRFSPLFLAAAAAVLSIAPAGLALLPLQPKPQHLIMRDAAAQIETPELRVQPLIAVNYWLYYWSDRWLPRQIEPWYAAVEKAKPGTVFAWDRRFCTSEDFDFTFATLANKPDWQIIWLSNGDGDDPLPFLTLFQRLPTTPTSTLTTP